MTKYTGKRARYGASIAAKLAFYSRDAASGCRLWLRRVDRDGYGKIRWKGMYRSVHRLAWEDANGPIPEGLCVCHTCDVRNCIHLEHLFLGTNAENTADRNAKNRQARQRGETCGTAKLTAEQVREIRKSRSTKAATARKYGISPAAVRKIVQRHTWAHVV